jgi:4-amino-4-deoxy-L-arabinose transferase-like glycosyltransferase
MVLVVWIALALRLAFIAGPSLRGDEALSVLYARRSLPEIVEISRTVSGHPPFFYGSLHVWEQVAGTTEFSTRFFAAWWGVLAVPLVFALGRALFGARLATLGARLVPSSASTELWAALLVAISPFHIMHGQDIRSYTMLTALSLLACWAFWRALVPAHNSHRPAWARWALYAASGIAVVHCHYFGAFLILAHGIFWLFVTAWALLGRDDRAPTDGPAQGGQGQHRIWGGILAFAAIIVSLLPWLWLARGVITGGHGPGGRTLPLWTMLQQTVVTFGIGYWREPWGWGLLTVGLAFLLGWGTYVAYRRAPRSAGFVTAIIVVPLLCLYLLSRSQPIFRERYLAFSAPAYALLIGVGLAAMGDQRRSRAWPWRLGLAMGALFVIGFNLFALQRYYVAPAYAKSPQWREAVSFLRQRLVPGDVVILNHQDQSFLYYYGDTDLLVLPAPGAQDARSVRASLQDLVARYDRVWLLPDTARLWDKEGLVPQWLDENSELALSRSWRGVLLQRYHTPRALQEERVPLDAQLEGGIGLLGYTLRDAEGRAVDRLDVERGGEVRLTLYWLAEAPVERDYVVFTHLLDGTGWLRGQQDNQPRRGTYPTRAWGPGELVIDSYRIPVALDAPPGEALIEVGMYDPASEQRLPISGRDADTEQRRVLLSGVVRIQ